MSNPRFEKQKKYDRLHHEKRVHDLSNLRGRLCSTHRELLSQSQRILDENCFPNNSVDIEDHEYLQRLDEFEERMGKGEV